MVAVFNLEVLSNILWIISFVAFFAVSCIAYNDLVSHAPVAQ
jgi:hypothetical protein